MLDQIRNPKSEIRNLVECVPNFSEGRKVETVERIAQAIESVSGVTVLNQHVDWPWFVLSQIGFGIVAGVVVSWQERIRTWQAVPLAIRAGVETPGLYTAQEQGERP